MGVAAEWIAAILLPTALGFGVLGAIRALHWAGERRARPPAVEPIERLSASLRRLRAELEELTGKPVQLNILEARPEKGRKEIQLGPQVTPGGTSGL